MNEVVVNINKELRDLDFKKNLDAKIGLCERAEELLLESSVVEAFRKLQVLHDQWREIGYEFGEPYEHRSFENPSQEPQIVLHNLIHLNPDQAEDLLRYIQLNQEKLQKMADEDEIIKGKALAQCYIILTRLGRKVQAKRKNT